MKTNTYIFHIDPKLWNSNKVLDIKDKLEGSSLDTHLNKLYNENQIEDAESKEIHTVNTYHLSNGDILKFSRTETEAMNLFQINLTTRKNRIPSYVKNILTKLGNDMSSIAGYQTNVKDISKKLFE